MRYRGARSADTRIHTSFPSGSLPPPSTVIKTLGSTATNFASRHPVVTALYFFGILVAALGTGMSPSDDQMKQYRQLSNIDRSSEIQANRDVEYWETEYSRTKGWFWQCDEKCQDNKAELQSAKRRMAFEISAREAQIRSAKASVGVMSTVAVDETRKSFWSHMSSGKKSGARMSMFDAVFRGIHAFSNKEPVASYVIQMIIQILTNFTFGFFYYVIIFIFSLFSLVSAYSPGLILGSVYFISASCAALSVVLTVVLAMWLGVGAVAYTGVIVAQKVMIEDDRPRYSRVTAR